MYWWGVANYFNLFSIITNQLLLIILIRYFNTTKLLKSDGQIENKFLKLGKFLGKGSFGTVYKSKIFFVDVAIKKLKYDLSNQEEIFSELNILKKLKNKNVVELYAYSTYESAQNNYIYLIFEIIKGGDLYSALKKDILNDKQKFNILFQITNGISYLHSLNIIHRGIFINKN
jgi:serine/threonine protein kinase